MHKNTQTDYGQMPLFLTVSFKMNVGMVNHTQFSGISGCFFFVGRSFELIGMNYDFNQVCDLVYKLGLFYGLLGLVLI